MYIYFLKESTTCASIAIMSKQCRLLDVTKSTASRPQTPIDWEMSILVFKDDIGSALAKVCEYNMDRDTVNLA